MRATAGLVLLAGCGGLSVHAVPEDDGTLEPVGTTAEGDADADADADTDGDVDVDSATTEPCEPPDLWDLVPTPPIAGGFNPPYVGVHMDGIVDSGQLYDLSFDGTPVSAWVVFTFYDASFYPLCTVVFDASDAASPTADPPVQSGQRLFESWSLSLTANQGYTDCPSIGGNVDPRAFLANRYWGISYGQLVDNQASLRTAVESAYPGTWNSAWAPYVFATFVDVGGPAAIEVGYVFGFEHDCYDVTTGSAAAPKPTSGPLDLYVGSANDWTILSVSALP